MERPKGEWTMAGILVLALALPFVQDALRNSPEFVTFANGVRLAIGSALGF